MLLNYPTIWVSRIHLVLAFGILMSAFSALVGFLIPVDVTQTQSLGLWYFLFTILAIVALCFWIYRNIIFNIEKKFGKRKWFDEYKVFFLNFICVLIFASFPVSFTAIYNLRVALTVSDEELLSDINKLNIGDSYVINNIGNYETYYDTTKNINYYNLNHRLTFENYTPWELKENKRAYSGLLHTPELETIYKRHHSEHEIKGYILDYISVHKKYNLDYGQFSNAVDSIYTRYVTLLKNSPIDGANLNYNYYYSSEMENTLSNIARAKFRPLFIWETDFLVFIFYTALYLSLLIMLFKMVQWRQFLLTLLSLILIPILLFIATQLLPYSGRDNTYVTLLLTTFGVAICFTCFDFGKTKQFNAFRNICAQIVYLGMPVLPLVIVALSRSFFYDYNYDYAVTEAMPVAVAEVPDTLKNPLVDSLTSDSALIALTQSNTMEVMNSAAQNNFYNSANYIYHQLEQEYWMRMYEFSLMIAMYGGIVLFIIVIVPLMKQLFVKQLALPRKS